METLFDAYLIVDWSSNLSPKKGADSIWIGWTRRADGSAKTLNPSTRAEASRMVLDLLRRWAADGDRILAGVDFAYGYKTLRGRGKIGIQEVWKVCYPGSVGGQILTGIPVLEKIRFASDLEPISRVWPFETGFTAKPVPSAGPFILHAEIWPGILDQLDTTGIRDQAQVRELSRLLRQWDEGGRLGELFDRPANLTDEEVRASVEEESWTLGSQSL